MKNMDGKLNAFFNSLLQIMELVDSSDGLSRGIGDLFKEYPIDMIGNLGETETVSKEWGGYLEDYYYEHRDDNNIKRPYQFVESPKEWGDLKRKISEKADSNIHAHSHFDAIFGMTESKYREYQQFLAFYSLTNETRNQIKRQLDSYGTRVDEIAKSKADEAANKAATAAATRVRPLVSQMAINATLTCIGIISAILLVFNTDLIFSSSVLNNINAANPYRLILISLMCGFVCFNLIGLILFFFRKHSIEDNSKWYQHFSTWFVVIIDMVLIVGIILCCVGWNNGWIEERAYSAPKESATEIETETEPGTETQTETDNSLTIQMDVRVYDGGETTYDAF